MVDLMVDDLLRLRIFMKINVCENNSSRQNVVTIYVARIFQADCIALTLFLCI